MKKKHFPAGVERNKTAHDFGAIYRLLDKVQLFSPDELRRLALPIRVSFESMKSGTGVRSDYQDLADAINVAMVRAETIDPLAEEMTLVARDAMLRVLERFSRTGRWGFDGPAIAQVQEAVEFHEQLLRLSTPHQMIEAMREVYRRVDKDWANKGLEVTP